VRDTEFEARRGRVEISTAFVPGNSIRRDRRRLFRAIDQLLLQESLDCRQLVQRDVFALESRCWKFGLGIADALRRVPNIKLSAAHL
jgi:hypothetical protein